MPKQRGKLTKERTLQKLVKEVGILQRIQECPNVVRLLGCYEDTDHVMLVTELCEGGDLQKLSDVSEAHRGVGARFLSTFVLSGNEPRDEELAHGRAGSWMGKKLMSARLPSCSLTFYSRCQLQQQKDSFSTGAVFQHNVTTQSQQQQVQVDVENSYRVKAVKGPRSHC
jgi:hypothetical protein